MKPEPQITATKTRARLANNLVDFVVLCEFKRLLSSSTEILYCETVAQTLSHISTAKPSLKRILTSLQQSRRLNTFFCLNCEDLIAYVVGKVRLNRARYLHLLVINHHLKRHPLIIHPEG